MNMHKLLCFAFAVSLFSLLAFSNMSGVLDAAAIDPSQTVELTADQWYNMIGTPDCYYLGTDQQYHSITPTRYASPPSITSCNVAGYDVSELTSRPTVWLKFTYPQDFAPNTQEPYYPIIRLDLDLHFSNVSYCDFGAGSQYVYSDGSALAYATQNISVFSPWFYSIIGDHVSDVLPLSASRTDTGIGGTANYSNGVWSSMNAHKIERQSPADLYFGEISVAAVGLENYTGSFYIILTAPVLNAGYQFVGHAAPPSGGGGGGGSVTPPYDGDGQSVGSVTGTISENSEGEQEVNVNVTMDNGGLIGGLLSGLKNLFVPSDQALEDFRDDMQETFEEHLGGVAEAVTYIDEQLDYFENVTGSETLYFPGVSVPVGQGGSLVTIMQPQHVELKPLSGEGESMHLLWHMAEFAVDVVCVCAVLNMLQTKYEIFLNPDGEVITYDN